MGTMHAVRSLAFHVEGLPAPILALMGEFRLIVNTSIRIALRGDICSRFWLSKAAYGGLSAEHNIHKPYDLLRGGAGAREEPSGVESQSGVIQ
jgi:hypothetical protein